MNTFTEKLQDGANFIFRLIPRKKPTADQLKDVKLVAHRGAWKTTGHIENTIPAFTACLGKGIWAIEFDLRWTIDNVPVIHHDSTLQRVFNDPRKIEDMNFIDLRREFPSIPSLDEVINHFHTQLHFMIEIKQALSPIRMQILEHSLQKIKPIQDFHIMSLEFAHLIDLKFTPPKSLVSIGRTDLKQIFHKTLETSLGGLTGHYLLLNKNMLKQCKDNQIKTGSGFPNSKNSLYREIHRGTDWIFTNHAIELSRLCDL